MPDFPKNISFAIERNDHAIMYYTVAEYVEINSISIDEEELKRAVELDELWVFTWYPDNTVGFHQVAAASYERMMELAKAETAKL